MPIDWIIEAAHEADTSVYGMLQPYFGDGRRYNTKVEHATPEMMRAAAANFCQVGVDGLYTWFLDWPLGNNERRILTDISDSEQSKEGNKHYFLRQRADEEDAFVYPAQLPVAIPHADPEQAYEVSFTISDDPENDRIQRMTLKINVGELVAQDRFEISLNGVSLESDPRRSTPRHHTPYTGVWLEFELHKVRPHRGVNTLKFVLLERPKDFDGAISIDDVELVVECDVFPNSRRLIVRSMPTSP